MVPTHTFWKVELTENGLLVTAGTEEMREWLESPLPSNAFTRFETFRPDPTLVPGGRSALTSMDPPALPAVATGIRNGTKPR